MLIEGVGEAWAHTCKRGTSLSSQESARKLGIDYICQAQESRGGPILSWLEKSRTNLFPNGTGSSSLPGTCRRSQSSFSPCWGAGIWMQSSILWPCCVSKGTSAWQILLPSSCAEYGLLTDAKIQESALHALLSPASPRAGATLLCLQTLRIVSLSLKSSPITLFKSPQCTPAIASWRLVSPPLVLETLI